MIFIKNGLVTLENWGKSTYLIFGSKMINTSLEGLFKLREDN